MLDVNLHQCIKDIFWGGTHSLSGFIAATTDSLACSLTEEERRHQDERWDIILQWESLAVF